MFTRSTHCIWAVLKFWIFRLIANKISTNTQLDLGILRAIFQLNLSISRNGSSFQMIYLKMQHKNLTRSQNPFHFHLTFRPPNHSIPVSSINSIMPVIRRILDPIPIPIPPWNTMHLFLLPPPFGPSHTSPTAIPDTTPTSLVRDGVFPCAEVISLLGAPLCPRKGTASRIPLIFVPSRPFLPRGPAGARMWRSTSVSPFSLLESSDVDIWSLACEDVEEAPASRPVVWIAGARVFGPNPP